MASTNEIAILALIISAYKNVLHIYRKYRNSHTQAPDFRAFLSNYQKALIKVCDIFVIISRYTGILFFYFFLLFLFYKRTMLHTRNVMHNNDIPTNKMIYVCSLIKIIHYSTSTLVCCCGAPLLLSLFCSVEETQFPRNHP